MLDDLIADCLIRHGAIPPEIAGLSFHQLLTVLATRERSRREQQEGRETQGSETPPQNDTPTS